MIGDWGKRFQGVKWLWVVVAWSGVLVLVAWLSVRSPLLGVLALVASIGLTIALVWSVTLTQRRLVITLLVFSILGPNLPTPGLLKVRPEELVVLALIPVILIHLRLRWNWIDICFGLVGVSTVVSIAGGLLADLPFSPRDLMELVKLVRFWIFFRLALYCWTERDIRFIAYWLLGSMAIAMLIAVVQWQNWMEIGALTKNLYGQGAVHIRRGRVMGTMPNPNYFAQLMIAGLAFIIGALQWHRRRWVLVALGGLCLAVVTFTNSRSGVLVAGIVLFIAVGVHIMWLRRVSLRRRWFRIVVILIVATAVGIAATTWLLGELESLETMNAAEKLEYSLQSPIHRTVFRFGFFEKGLDTRVTTWQENLEPFWESPLIGSGPGKASYGITDNGYVMYLRRYGLVGLVFNLLLYGQVLRVCWKSLRLYPYQSVEWATALSIMAMTLAFLAANMFMEIFYHLQLMSFFWLMVGIGYSTLYFRTELQEGAP